MTVISIWKLPLKPVVWTPLRSTCYSLQLVNLVSLASGMPLTLKSVIYLYICLNSTFYKATTCQLYRFLCSQFLWMCIQLIHCKVRWCKPFFVFEFHFYSPHAKEAVQDYETQDKARESFGEAGGKIIHVHGCLTRSKQPCTISFFLVMFIF